MLSPVTVTVALALDVPMPVKALKVADELSTVQLKVDIVPSDELALTIPSAVVLLNHPLSPFGVNKSDVVGGTGTSPSRKYVPVRVETGTLPHALTPEVTTIFEAFNQLVPL